MAPLAQARPLTDAALAGDLDAQAQLHDFLIDVGYNPALVEGMMAGVRLLSASAPRTLGFPDDYQRAVEAGIVEPVRFQIESQGVLQHYIDQIHLGTTSLKELDTEPDWRAAGPVIRASEFASETTWWMGRDDAERYLARSPGLLAGSPIPLPALPEGVYWDVVIRPCLVSVEPMLLDQDGYQGPLPPHRHINCAFC